MRKSPISSYMYFVAFTIHFDMIQIYFTRY